MSHDAQLDDNRRLQEILGFVTDLAQGKNDDQKSLSGKGDIFDQILEQLNLIAKDASRRQAVVAEEERRGNELLQMMLTMAVGDYSTRTPVGDDDSIFDALATGMNMLNEELAAYRETRERLQEEIIQVQADALRELSTPIIPITDDVLIMPLIGKLDAQRTQQVLETLLLGIAARQADVAILDITGVPVIDTQVANGLVRAAQAAQLLGTRVVLTGMRPEVAQILVELTINLSQIATYGTLQAGVNAVLNQSARAANKGAKLRPGSQEQGLLLNRERK